jgi:hypothetical protein
MRIAICTAASGDPKLGYTRALLQMCIATERAAKSAPLMFEYLTASSPNPVFARTELVSAARQIGADHLLWIDADLTFPQDTLLRLIARRQRVVGVNYVAKETRRPSARALDGTPLVTTPDQAEARAMEECGAIGLGLAFMEMAVFDEIAAPWFALGWDAAGAPVSEADHFCAQLRAAGIPIHVDHGLSAKTGPVVDQVLTHGGARVERILDGVVRSRVGAPVPMR